jgi:hypothetical protein
MELLRNSKDKKARKLTKKRVRTSCGCCRRRGMRRESEADIFLLASTSSVSASLNNAHLSSDVAALPGWPPYPVVLLARSVTSAPSFALGSHPITPTTI